MRKLAALVWIDFQSARIFDLLEDPPVAKTVPASLASPEGMYDRVAAEIKNLSGILVVGPGVAKYGLLARLREHFPLIAKSVASCQDVGHLSDGELLAYARNWKGF